MTTPTCCEKCAKWEDDTGRKCFMIPFCKDLRCPCHTQPAEPIKITLPEPGEGHRGMFKASTPTWGESVRATLEKIIWKRYNPPHSLNVEELLDEMMPVLHRIEQEAYARGLAAETDIENSPWAKAFEAQIREDERRKVIERTSYLLHHYYVHCDERMRAATFTPEQFLGVLQTDLEARTGSKSEGVC